MARSVAGSPPRWVPAGVMLIVVLAWSGAFAMIKLALKDVTPLDLVVLRFAAAAPFFGAILAWTGLPRFSREEWPRVALVAFLSVAGYHVALNAGETAISAGVAALIIATGPVWTAALSASLLKERVGPRKLVGVALAVAGVVVLVLGHGEGFSVGYVGGALVALTAPAMWALSSVTSKPLLVRHGPLAFTAAVTLLGTAFLAPLVATGTIGRAASASAWTWIAILHLGVACTVVGYMGFNFALRHLSATDTMAFVYLNPVLAVGWSVLLVDEPVTAAVVAGGALVVAGVAITNWPAASAASAPASRTAAGAGVDEPEDG